MKSNSLADWVRQRIDEARRTSPNLIAPNGDAFMVWGTIGSCGYISAEGEVYLEEDTMDPVPGTFIIHRGERARRQVLFFAARRYPELSAYLPQRSASDPDCEACTGTGWRSIREHRIFCDTCDGRGWIDVSFPAEPHNLSLQRRSPFRATIGRVLAAERQDVGQIRCGASII